MNNIALINDIVLFIESFLKEAMYFLPTLFLATSVFVVGWFIAIGLGKIITKILKKIKLNQVFEKGIGKDALEKAEWKISPAEFIGLTFKWILFIVVLSVTAEILGMVQFVAFLHRILGFLEQVVVAILIFVVAVFIAEYLSKIVRVWMEGMKSGYSAMAAIIVKIAIWMFALFAILVELGIAQALVVILFQGIVAFLVIAGGIAFGLGGKEVAAGILKDLQKKLKK